MLICKNCGNDKFDTKDTRNRCLDTDYLMRYKVCRDCGYKFMTCEITRSDYDKYHSYINKYKKLVRLINKCMKDVSN